MVDKHEFVADKSAATAVEFDEPGLDVLIPQNRMNETARRLLEAMGVSIRSVHWGDRRGPPVYRLLSRGLPRLGWLAPSKAEDLITAFKRDEDEFHMPDWFHLMLYAHRQGGLTESDGSIDFGDYGLDARLVVRDLLHYPC